MAGLGSARQEVGTVRRRKRNSGRQKRYCQREKPATSAGLQHRVYALGSETDAISSKRSEEGRDYLSLKFDDPALKMAVHSNSKATRLVATPCSGGDRGRTPSKAGSVKPRRIDWAGLRKDGQPRPRRAANEGRTEASEDLSPGKRRHPNL